MIKLVPISLIVLLAGCSLHNSSQDMSNNQYLELEPINIELSGIYTGVLNRYISTYIINRDGSGVICGLYEGNAILGRLKFYEKEGMTYRVVTETGLKYSFTKNQDDTVVLESYGKEINLKPDSELKIANLACKEKLTPLLES